MAHKSLSEHLRPNILQDLTLPSRVIDRLQKMVDSREIMNFLFYGKPGTGKTSAARMIGNLADCAIFNFNGSLLGGDKGAARRIGDYATTKSLINETKLFIIDEADNATLDFQKSIRTIIEDTYAVSRYILITNDAKKIIPALKSRLYEIDFDVPINEKANAIAKITGILKTKVKSYGISISDDRLSQIVAGSYPDYRAIANKIDFELG